jgi:hypothetical protein
LCYTIRRGEFEFVDVYGRVVNQNFGPKVEINTVASYLYYSYLTNLRRKKQEIENQFTTKDDSKRYLNLIKIAFSKVLKEPKTPDGVKVRNNFIKQAAENYARIMANKRYSVILYPESSKAFNALFANYLSKLYGVPAQQGFSKLPAGQVTIDEPAIRAHFGDRADDVTNQLKYGLPPRYPGIESYNKDKTLQIKHFKQDYRRYIKMWQPTGNYRKGGTLERIYDLVKQQAPRSVDIYTPLYIGGGHGITHS